MSKLTKLLVVLMIIGINSGCAGFLPPSKYDEELKFPDPPNVDKTFTISEEQKNELKKPIDKPVAVKVGEFIIDKETIDKIKEIPESETVKLYMTKDGKMTIDKDRAEYIVGYYPQEHEKIVELVKRYSFTKDSFFLITDILENNEQLIQNIEMDHYLTKKQLILLEHIRNVEKSEYERRIYWYKFKDLGYSTLSIILLLLIQIGGIL